MHDVWPSPGLVHHIYIFGALAPEWNLLGAKFSSLALFYIGSVTARYSISGRQPNFAAWYNGMELWNFRSPFSIEGATYIPRSAITLDIGPHSSYRQHCEQRKPPVFNLLKRPILRFYAPQGRRVAPIGVKFGIPSSMPNFTPIGATTKG